MPVGYTRPAPVGAGRGGRAPRGGRLALAALVGFASFAIGGYVVGLKSLGRTVGEPGVSTAILLGLLLDGALTFGNLPAGGVVPFFAGLLAGHSARPSVLSH